MRWRGRILVLASACTYLTLSPSAHAQQAAELDVDTWMEAVRNHRTGVLDASLQTIAAWPWTRLKPVLNAVWQRGDVTLLLRGATLHADISASTSADQRLRAPTGGVAIVAVDGQRVGTTGLDSHIWWGRRLLDRISPTHPAWERARPALVAWYRAVAAMLAARTWLVDLEPHLERALERFPDDAGILFDAGCMAETFATQAIQAAMGPDERHPSRTSTLAELHRYRTSPVVYVTQAEKYFRRATEQDPSFAEPHVRLGRVLLIRRKHDDAIASLRTALTLPATPPVRYYNQMFLGRALQGAGRLAEARTAYERAASLFPDAPSARLAVASLASTEGDFAGARSGVEGVFHLPAEVDAAAEPWWDYHRCAGRDVEAAYLVLAREMESVR